MPFFSNQQLAVDSAKHLASQTKPDGIDIVFENINYKIQVIDEEVKTIVPCKRKYKDKQLIKNITGIFKAGKVNAIMGASGAGKTTLLNILACRISFQNGGKLYANNTQYNYKTFGDFANYVMQNDILMQTLTVRQTLQFAASLKLNLQKRQIKQKVVELVTRLKLQNCLDTLVGGVILKGISGGQRKRTSIAFELISDPQVIFLDQPTSGLDSLTSYIIVTQLQKMAHNQNKTVIMTIHQPNSQIFNQFDNLTLMLEGKIIYQGQAKEVRQYFSTHFKLQCPKYANISDFVMSKMHYEDKQNRERYANYFETYQKFQNPKVLKMIQTKQTSNLTQRSVNTSFCQGLQALTYRSFLNTLRNPMLIRSKLIQGSFMSLFIGGLFFDIGTKDYTVQSYWYSITGFLFFITIFALMGALSTVVLTFPLEREVFFKQQDSKMYSVSQYFLGRNLVQLPELFLIPLINVCIYYFMIDLSNTAGQFFLHYLTFCLISFTGSSLGLLLGSAILDSKSVSAVMPLILMPVILFSGFYKNRQDLPVWIGWIQYISPNKYGFIVNINNQTAFKASRIQDLHLDVQKWSAIGILVALGVTFRLFSLFFLWFLRKRSQ